MAISSTMKLTELPLRNKIPIPSSHSPSLHFLFFSSPFPSKPSFYPLLKPFSSLHTNPLHSSTPNPTLHSKSTSSSSPWLNKWPSPNPPIEKSNSKSNSNSKPVSSKPDKRSEIRQSDGPNRTTAIERIVLRLRNLGLGSDDEEEEEEGGNENSAMPVTGEEKLGDLLRRDWVRPDMMLIEEDDETVLPWERRGEEEEERGREGKKRAARAPTLAELTLEDKELRRLRTLGMMIRERVSVPKAGITGPILEKIHDQWRKSEVVRLKFHEVLARDMKTAHEIIEVGEFR